MAQVGGAATRLLAGYVSDRVGSRLGPMRTLAGGIAAAMAALGAAAGGTGPVATAVLVATLLATVSTNGLAFTAVAEYAGRSWAGRALGIQNTAQNALATATPPLVAAAVDLGGYPATFASVAAFPLLASLVIPVAAEARRRPPAVVGGPVGQSSSPRGAGAPPNIMSQSVR